jgi:enamine deaminase RidA (YjgF/YER057c/UK114 family)
MSGKLDKHLADSGIVIPDVVSSAGNYVGFVASAGLIFIAGQLPMEHGKCKFVGKLGRELQVDAGRSAAELAAMNMLAHLKAACSGNLDRVLRCVKVVGFVNAVEDFQDHPKVMNGASDLLVRVFGDAGRHARSAVGVGSLPFGVPVEVEGIFQIRV